MMALELENKGNFIELTRGLMGAINREEFFANSWSLQQGN